MRTPGSLSCALTRFVGVQFPNRLFAWGARAMVTHLGMSRFALLLSGDFNLSHYKFNLRRDLLGAINVGVGELIGAKTEHILSGRHRALQLIGGRLGGGMSLGLGNSMEHALDVTLDYFSGSRQNDFLLRHFLAELPKEMVKGIVMDSSFHLAHFGIGLLFRAKSLRLPARHIEYERVRERIKNNQDLMPIRRQDFYFTFLEKNCEASATLSTLIHRGPEDFQLAWKNPRTRELLTEAMRRDVFLTQASNLDPFIKEIDHVLERETNNEKIFKRLREKFLELKTGSPEAPQDERRIKKVSLRVQQLVDLSGVTCPSNYLDIGCSSGDITVPFGNRLGLSKENILGVDVVRSPNSSNFEGLTHTLYDGAHLPFEDNSIEFITALSVLHHTQNLEMLIREIHRVLKPGGSFLVREMGAYTSADWAFQYHMDLLWYHVFLDLPEVPNPGHFLNSRAWRHLITSTGLKHFFTSYVELESPYQPVFMMFKK
ncbi:MAG: methyltransferase domain-containing protein [Deltaproteobacteria bacterium]|nr:methyltransferase domain-containing protein [Deltaproteobacteria bacterium]